MSRLVDALMEIGKYEFGVNEFRTLASPEVQLSRKVGAVFDLGNKGIFGVLEGMLVYRKAQGEDFPLIPSLAWAEGCKA